MRKSSVILLLLLVLLQGCGHVPVAVECPLPRPIPDVLTSPASTGPSISERTENSFKKFEDSVTKAQRAP